MARVVACRETQSVRHQRDPALTGRLPRTALERRQVRQGWRWTSRGTSMSAPAVAMLFVVVPTHPYQYL